MKYDLAVKQSLLSTGQCELRCDDCAADHQAAAAAADKRRPKHQALNGISLSKIDGLLK
jgi:hypothetical protein